MDCRLIIFVVRRTVAAYALPDSDGADPLASLVAELRVAPLRMPPGPDAAEFSDASWEARR